MVTLSMPDIDDHAVVLQVVQERQNGRNRVYFNSKQQYWIDRVAEYIEAEGNPETIDSSEIIDTDKVKFLTLYLSPKDASAQKLQVLNVIRAHDLDFCPSCGEDGFPRTLDHYLPKEEYPEFSILSVNLAPMCDSCQGAKGTRTLNDHGEKIYLHPYYNSIVGLQVLKARIEGQFGRGTTSTLLVNEDLPADIKRICISHSDELKLKNRYSRYFRSQYIRLLRLVKELRTDEELELPSIRSCIALFKRNARLKGLNSWDHVFYSSVLENGPLLNYLANADIPDN